jgi:hypothetical protein
LSVYVAVQARRLVNPSFYHSEVVKVRKILVNASISGFYQTISVNNSIYQHQLVKARNGRAYKHFSDFYYLTMVNVRIYR